MSANLLLKKLKIILNYFQIMIKVSWWQSTVWVLSSALSAISNSWGKIKTKSYGLKQEYLLNSFRWDLVCMYNLYTSFILLKLSSWMLGVNDKSYNQWTSDMDLHWSYAIDECGSSPDPGQWNHQIDFKPSFKSREIKNIFKSVPKP